MRRVVVLLLACGASVAATAPAAAQPPKPVAVSVELPGTINLATSASVSAALEDAVERRATVVIPMDVLTAVHDKVGETNGAARGGR